MVGAKGYIMPQDMTDKIETFFLKVIKKADVRLKTEPGLADKKKYNQLREDAKNAQLLIKKLYFELENFEETGDFELGS